MNRQQALEFVLDPIPACNVQHCECVTCRWVIISKSLVRLMNKKGVE